MNIQRQTSSPQTYFLPENRATLSSQSNKAIAFVKPGNRPLRWSQIASYLALAFSTRST
jgi:hypothetical protein